MRSSLIWKRVRVYGVSNDQEIPTKNIHDIPKKIVGTHSNTVVNLFQNETLIQHLHWIRSHPSAMHSLAWYHRMAVMWLWIMGMCPAKVPLSQDSRGWGGQKMKSNRNNVDIIFEEINNISVPQFDIRIDLENLKHGLRRILFWLSFGWLSKAI